WRLLGATLAVSLTIFLAVAPYARIELPYILAFIPIYQSSVISNDLVTAVLLFGHYLFLRTPALLVLVCGYIFNAVMAAAHALGFPGLFAAQGLLGGGSQVEPWLYLIWHGGFPLFVLAYHYVKNGRRGAAITEKLSQPSLTTIFAWLLLSTFALCG